jgi:hypothetical protein
MEGSLELTSRENLEQFGLLRNCKSLNIFDFSCPAIFEIVPAEQCSQRMKPKRNELTSSSLRVFDEQLEIGKPQKPPNFYYPCHDKSLETTDFSNWSYFQTHPKKKIVNIGSAHLWNQKTLKNITDRDYKIPEIRKKMKTSPSKLPTPRTTRAERMRQNYILANTPTLEDERSTTHASKGGETISQVASIKSTESLEMERKGNET